VTAIQGYYDLLCMIIAQLAGLSPSLFILIMYCEDSYEFRVLIAREEFGKYQHRPQVAMSKAWPSVRKCAD
jgi:hypothetical protein